MNWTQTQARLASDKGRWSHIARETGLHINAVRKIAVGETPTPRISSVEKIIEFYEREDGARAEPERAAS
jgi:hypothetical protein